ncbi:MAG: ASCH domain-containing protein [Thermoplasmata archaeon]
MTERPENSKVERYWQAYLDSLESDVAKPESYEVWHFGDTEEGARKLARLVRSGQKTATSGLVWELEAKGFGVPNEGDVVVVVDLEQEPYCVIELTEVEVIPFAEIVDEQFALDYGEGIASLSSWKKSSWAYFSEMCKELGREPSGNMPIACQRFRLLFAGQPEPAI